MWFSFWRSRDRFSLDELRYLTDQLQKVLIVNEVNKDFIIEALRSIAELVTYGDQHDHTFFEFFMEKQVMGDFFRILKISRTASVALQLLQTMSIMIQNLKSDHAIYYIFSNEHINYLITYSFDFNNDELLSYYISFLRAISGKLNKSTISLLVKTQNDEVVSFPLYTEAIRYAFHEESMVRIAVRALTLNVYHVGDESVNRYVTSAPLADYFSDLVKYFRKQCINLDGLVSVAAKNTGPSEPSSIIGAVDEIEDTLYYFSDVISSGVPNLARLITSNMLQLLVFPLLLPSLKMVSSDGTRIGATTSLYLLCCILRIVKTKDLAGSIAAAFFCPLEVFSLKSESKSNGYISGHGLSHENQQMDHNNGSVEADTKNLSVSIPNSSFSQINDRHLLPQRLQNAQLLALRDVLLSFIVTGDDSQVLGSLSVLGTLLQTKELDESMLDALGILPQRKQHKKLLLEALVGEGSGEEQLFSSQSSLMEDGISNELDGYLEKLKDQFGLCSFVEAGISPRVHRYQVLDALISLFCRSNISPETLRDGGWLLRQLLPHGKGEFSSHHLKSLRDAYKDCVDNLVGEFRGSWCDMLIAVLTDEWRKCRKAFEASSPKNDPKCILFPQRTCSLEGESSFTSGERMHDRVKVFVLRHQLRIFTNGGALPDQPLVISSTDPLASSRVTSAGLDAIVPKPGTEVKLVDAVPCRIAFERGKERHFCFLAVSRETFGWILLVEELPLKHQYGVVRVIAPLAGSDPRIDDRHPKWLHLRIRPSTLPSFGPTKPEESIKFKTKSLIDGRWTLAFKDEQSCKSAESMIFEEMQIQSSEVERRLRPLLELDSLVHGKEPSVPPVDTASTNQSVNQSQSVDTASAT